MTHSLKSLKSIYKEHGVVADSSTREEWQEQQSSIWKSVADYKFTKTGEAF